MVRLLEHFADLKPVVGPARETRKHWREAQLTFDPAGGRRLAEEMCHGDPRLHIVGPQPAGDRRGRQVELDLHSVRLELLHLERRAAKRLAAFLVPHEIGHRLVRPGRRRGWTRVGDLVERRRGKRQLIAADDQPSRIGDLDHEREPGDRGLPVRGSRDDAQVRRLARPVDATVGEQIAGQLLRGLRALDAACVEPRDVEIAPSRAERQERQISDPCARGSSAEADRASRRAAAWRAARVHVASVVAASTARPLAPTSSTLAPSTGRPLRIDWTNTSRLPSFACLMMNPRSVIRMRRASSLLRRPYRLGSSESPSSPGAPALSEVAGAAEHSLSECAAAGVHATTMFAPEGTDRRRCCRRWACRAGSRGSRASRRCARPAGLRARRRARGARSRTSRPRDAAADSAARARFRPAPSRCLAPGTRPCDPLTTTAASPARGTSAHAGTARPCIVATNGFPDRYPPVPSTPSLTTTNR